MRTFVNNCLKHVLIVTLALTAVAAEAQLGKGKGNSDRGDAGVMNNLTVDIGISSGEARAIARDLGLSGYDSLPPGIAKNVGRGKPLPPGIAKKAPPQNMLARLPQVEDHEWRVSGTDLVLVALGTAIVVEVLEEVFN